MRLVWATVAPLSHGSVAPRPRGECGYQAVPALIMSRLPPSPHCDNQLTGSALSAGSVAGTPGIRLPSLSALAGIPLLSGSGSGATSTVLASSAATPPVITVTPAGMAVPSLATLPLNAHRLYPGCNGSMPHCPPGDLPGSPTHPREDYRKDTERALCGLQRVPE